MSPGFTFFCLSKQYFPSLCPAPLSRKTSRTLQYIKHKTELWEMVVDSQLGKRLNGRRARHTSVRIWVQIPRTQVKCLAWCMHISNSHTREAVSPANARLSERPVSNAKMEVSSDTNRTLSHGSESSWSRQGSLPLTLVLQMVLMGPAKSHSAPF